MGLEWTTLKLIEDAPLTVRITTGGPYFPEDVKRMVAALGQIDSLDQEYDRRIHASVVSLYSYQDQSSFAAIVKFIPESINSFKSSLSDIETTNHQYWDELEPSVHDYANLLTLTAQAAADRRLIRRRRLRGCV
jgi:hypothetical protein